MATTGEECWHQKPLRTKLDEAYDILFDPDIEHNCDAFHELVVPARRCGGSCPQFKPLGAGSYSNPFRQATIQTALDDIRLVPVPIAPRDPAVVQAEVARTRDSALRTSIRRCLSGVYQRLDTRRELLRRQIATYAEQSRVLEGWLRRPERQSGWLTRAFRKAELERSRTIAKLQNLESQLDLKNPAHSQSQNHVHLRLQLEELTKYKRSCEQVIRLASLRQSDRAKKQDDLQRITLEWEEARQLVFLLTSLRQEVGRCVREGLDASPGHLRREDVDKSLEYLNSLARFAEADNPSFDVRMKVAEMSRFQLPIYGQRNE